MLRAYIGYQLRVLDSPVSCVAVSGDGNDIVCGSWDNTIWRWKLQRRLPISDLMYGHEDHVMCVSMNEDGSVIVSGSNDKQYCSGILKEAPIDAPLRGHEDPVSCVAVSEDGKDIVCGSWDKTVRRWVL